MHEHKYQTDCQQLHTQYYTGGSQTKWPQQFFNSLIVLGPLERYMKPTLDAALLISSRAVADLGGTSDRLLTS